ncbi:hypothetical protein D3C84_1224830 [compost metagenome]
MELAWLTSCWGVGRETIKTVKLTVTLVPGATVPTAMPVSGAAPGCGKPPTMTLLGSNVVPAGILSVKVTLAARLPVLLTTIE